MIPGFGKPRAGRRTGQARVISGSLMAFSRYCHKLQSCGNLDDKKTRKYSGIGYSHGMPDLLLQSASALRAQLLARKISAQELLAATVAQIERINTALNAIVEFDLATAERAAQESDARIAEGTPRPLEGLPITIKDCFEVTGMVTAVGAPALKAHRPQQDASAVARLRRAGANIFGKTNVPVFTGDFQTFNPVYGTTNNPWDVNRSPGGSSGGAAAAVATGMTAFELCSDLGGSIRWPAHACGLFGLKTTWNLVSTYGHIPPPLHRRPPRNPDLLVAGPLARSAADLALVLPILAGPREPSLAASPLPPARKTSPEGLRVAVWLDEPMAQVEASVAAAVQDAALRLADAGAKIDMKARPAFTFVESWEVFALFNHAVVGYGLPPKLRDKIAAQARGFAATDLSHQALQARGVNLSPGAYQALDMRRRHLRRHWARFFTQFDVLLCPPAPVGAIAHDQSPDIHARRIQIDGEAKPYLDLMMWASLATIADLPAAVAPIRIASDGLPRGVQIIAAAGEDLTAISVASMLETLAGGFVAPGIATIV
jgi:amidase